MGVIHEMGLVVSPDPRINSMLSRNKHDRIMSVSLNGAEIEHDIIVDHTKTLYYKAKLPRGRNRFDLLVDGCVEIKGLELISTRDKIRHFLHTGLFGLTSNKVQFVANDTPQITMDMTTVGFEFTIWNDGGQ